MIKKLRPTLATGSAVVLCLVLLGCGRTLSWEENKNSGDVAFEAGRYDEARRCYQEAVRQVEQFGSRDSRLAICLSALALTNYQQENYPEASRLYKRVLEYREKSG